jgi:hypothetical protein
MAILDFDEFVDLIRVRLGDADAIDTGRLHRFREDLLSEEERTVIPDGWYYDAFDELQAQGHLSDQSQKLYGLDACGRLSADGRLYLRTTDDS